ncbi:hypothetical protein MSPP1_001109 [Malassezia sp. CBS 17886]|nr:hypothetical protein MSPP1_001109 [Malassezia sp. CBS 17886]
MGPAGAACDVPLFSAAELQYEPQRIMHCVQAPSPADAQLAAQTRADLALRSRMAAVNGSRVPVDAVRGLVREAEAMNGESLAHLQHAESSLRLALLAALPDSDQAVDDDDVSVLARRLVDTMSARAGDARSGTPEHDKNTGAAHASRAKPVPPPHPLQIARTCTLWLSRAEEAIQRADSAGDQATELDALRTLAALGQQVSEDTVAHPMMARTAAAVVGERDGLYARLRSKYVDALRRALREVSWPPPELQNPDHVIPGEHPAFQLDVPPVRHAWTEVCELQLCAADAGICARPSCVHVLPSLSESPSSGSEPQPGSDEYVPLLAVQTLLEPILRRFRFHFDGQRSTNRLDKPEWFLSHMLALLQRNAPLFVPAPDPWTSGADIVELSRRRPVAAGDTASARQRHITVDAPAELLHNVLYPLRRKIFASVERLVAQPALLAHTIFQCLTFDADLRVVYIPAVLVADGRGAVRLADVVLGNVRWFRAWLDGEREFAESRFEKLMDAAGAWSLVHAETLTDEVDVSDDDVAVAVDAASATTTRCAATLVSILAGVTERYQPLESLEQRCAFVIKVQKPLLHQFHMRLARHLDAFENLSGAFSRAFPGEMAVLSSATGTERVRGTHGLSRVAKALLAAAFCQQQLEDWNESSFFLSMAQQVAALDPSSALYRLMSPAHDTGDIDSATLLATFKRGLQRSAAATGSATASFRPLSRTPRASDAAPLPAAARSDDVDMDAPGIWSDCRDKFAEIATRASGALERLVVAEVEAQLKPYVMRRWDQEDVLTDAGDVADADARPSATLPNPELLPALAKLSSLLSHLVQLLPANLLLPIYRRIASTLSSEVVARVIMPNARITQQFSAAQARQFRVDVEHGWLHVVQELSDLPIIAARRARNFPTGLGSNPASPWRLLVDASKQLS